MEPFLEKQRFFYLPTVMVLLTWMLEAHLLSFHAVHMTRLAAVTAVRPTSKVGALNLAEDGVRVNEFSEKPEKVAQIISGGFFVFEPEIF